MTRRVFLKNGGLALAAIGAGEAFGTGFLHRTVFAAEPERAKGGRRVLVCLFQRGAVDGLSMVVPYGDPDYAPQRPALAIPRKGDRNASVVDLDGFFGLHPALAPLKAVYEEGHLAPVHACGSPDNTRSHFDAQDFLETAAPGNKSVRTGWLTRTMAACPEDRAKRSSLRALALTERMPRSFQGDPDALAVADLAAFGVGDGADAFAAMYGESPDAELRSAGRASIEAVRTLRALDARGYRPARGAEYPRGKLGASMRQIAQLIKADVGLEVAFAECGGWDTHAGQGAAQGQLANRLGELGQALFAFWTDLGDRMDEVVLLTMSEFGRTVRQNGSLGTDHGHATCFLAMGGPVRGGRVAGKWPGLASDRLFQGRDLALTTDFRDVFAEVAARHLGARTPEKLFPEYRPEPSRYRDVIGT